MQNPNDNFVLARPLGGFNDMLCQLERVWRYCKAFDRVMVLDTRRSGMLDDLLRYYTLTDAKGVRVVPLAETGWNISSKDGQVNGADEDGSLLFERSWREEQGFDLKTAHPDRVLVHPTSGGGDLGIFFLERLTLRDEIKAHLRKAIEPLGQDYLSVHIRNTDWATDYETAFAAIDNKIRGRKVLVCSDDSRAVNYFRETYSEECDFRTTSELSNTDGTPLHYNENRDVWASNIAMLTDIYALAMGSQICMVDTYNGKRSGFALLAAHMLRRINSLDHPNAFDLGPRIPAYFRALRHRRPLRVHRVRNVGRDGKSRYFCHPTYE